MEALSVYFLVIGAIFIIQVLIVRWVFRINEQILYLKQIYEQLIHLNNANAAARTQEYYEKDAQKNGD